MRRKLIHTSVTLAKKQKLKKAFAKPVSPLAQLRRELRKTQKQFADIIGESKSYLEKMEQGTKDVPDRIARLLMLLYGVDHNSLKSHAGKLKHLLGRRRLGDLISEWEAIIPLAQVDTSLMLEQQVLPKLDLLHKAAANEQRAIHLLMRLDGWIAETAKTLRLEAAVRCEQKRRALKGDHIKWRPLIRFGPVRKNRFQVLFSLGIAEPTAALLDPVNHSTPSGEDRGVPQVNPGRMKRLVQLAKSSKAKAP